MPTKPNEGNPVSDRPNVPILNKHWVDKVPIIRYRDINEYAIELIDCSRDYLLYAIDNHDIIVNKYILNENDYMTLIEDPNSFWNEHIDPFLKKHKLLYQKDVNIKKEIIKGRRLTQVESDLIAIQDPINTTAHDEIIGTL